MQTHDDADSVRGIVERWAAQQPDASALLAPGRPPCSWLELRAQMTETEARLAEVDIGPGHVVAVALDDGPEAASAIVTVAASAACAAVNRAAPAAELASTLDRLGVEAMIVAADDHGPAREAAMTSGVTVLELAAGDVAGRFRLSAKVARPGVGADRRRVARIARADTAFLAETSGTTGARKVLARSQRQQCLSARHIAGALGLRPDDRSLVVLPQLFGYGRDTALFAALISGGGAICTSGFDSRRFFEWVEQSTATWVAATPPMHHALSLLGRATPQRAANSPLRLLRSGSAPMLPGVIDAVESTFQAPLLVAYASTEAGIIASERPPPLPRKRGTVGTAAGAEIAIVDDGAFIGTGEAGEIVVRSPWAMTPTGDPELDGANFVDGWLRTGDLGLLDADGFLTINGRVKDLINRGGEKISPTEIEAVLLEHPAVTEAVVFGVPHKTLGEEVAAIVVGKEGTEPNEAELRRHTAAHLSATKVPRRIVRVDEVPLSAAGKVQRAGLADVIGLTDMGPDFVEPPRTALEATVAGIWAAALALERVSLTAEFVDVGGDSLAAVEVMAAIEEECGVRLPEESLLEPGATVAAVAAAVADVLAGAGHHDRSRPILLKSGQQDARPFFCFPGIGGHALMLHRLAMATVSARPFYGMRALGLGEGEAAPTHMTELAAHHVDQIRRIQPHGPYAIGGYSFGGYIAFEVGRLLHADGDAVECLVLLDTSAPGVRRRTSLLTRVRRRVGRDAQRVRRALRRGEVEPHARGTVELHPFVATVRGASRRAAQSWHPQTTPLPLVVLSTEHGRTELGGDPTLGWAKLATMQITTRPMSGHHHSAIDHPHVTDLGVTLGAVLGDGADAP